MKKAFIVIRNVSITLIVTLLMGLLFLIKDGFRPLEVTELTLPEQSTQSWEEIFSNPQNINAQSYVTGTMTGNKLVTLDDTHTDIDKIDKTSITEIITTLVTHETRGNTIIDAGLSDDFIDKPLGNFSPIQSLLVKLIADSEGSNTRETVISEQFTDINSLFLTHLHGDHTSGLVNLVDTLPIFLNQSEISFMNKAMVNNHFTGKTNVQSFDFSSGHLIAPFESVIDIYGDNSFFAISTPGHSTGHTSFLVNAQSGPILITGDAIAYYEQITYSIGPNPMMGDIAKESFDNIIAFIKAFPELRVIVGHDYCNINIENEPNSVFDSCEQG